MCTPYGKEYVSGECAYTGVLDLKQAQEWVVTTKLGASDKRPGTQAGPTSLLPSLKHPDTNPLPVSTLPLMPAYPG